MTGSSPITERVAEMRAAMALVAISPEKPDGSLTMQEKNSLTFTVVSDPGNGIASGSASSCGHPARPSVPPSYKSELT
jgi:peroxiredoxin